MFYFFSVIRQCEGVYMFLQCVATKPDGTPAPRELVKLKVVDDSRNSDTAMMYNYTTDGKGQFYFKLPAFQPKTKSFTIHVCTTDLPISFF